MPRSPSVSSKLSPPEAQALSGALGWVSDMLAIGAIVGLIALLVSVIG